MYFSLGVVLVVGSLAAVSAYPDHVPATSGVCREMTPGHGASPQSSAKPFQVSTSASTLKNGGQLQVDITGDNFIGFYIQARDSQNNAVGTFIANPNVRVHDCNGMKSNAAHHTSRKTKAAVSVFWRAPPRFSGKVTFVATVVKEFTTFWTQIKSQSVDIQPLDPSGSSPNNRGKIRFEKARGRKKKVEKRARIMNRVKAQVPSEEKHPVTTTTTTTATGSSQPAAAAHPQNYYSYYPQQGGSSGHNNNKFPPRTSGASSNHYFPSQELLHSVPVSTSYTAVSSNYNKNHNQHYPQLKGTFPVLRPHPPGQQQQQAHQHHHQQFLSRPPPPPQYSLPAPGPYYSHPPRPGQSVNYRIKIKSSNLGKGKLGAGGNKQESAIPSIHNFHSASPYESHLLDDAGLGVGILDGGGKGGGGSSGFIPPKPLFGFRPNYYPFPLEDPNLLLHHHNNRRQRQQQQFPSKSGAFHFPSYSLENPPPPPPPPGPFYDEQLYPTMRQEQQQGPGPENYLHLPRYGLLIYNPKRGPPFYIIPDQDFLINELGLGGDNEFHPSVKVKAQTQAAPNNNSSGIKPRKHEA